MRIKPSARRAIPFVTSTGVHELPFSVFETDNGMTIIRIGDNTLWFDKNGAFDGTESRLSPEGAGAMQAELLAAMERSHAAVGTHPADTYFEEGTNGHTAEVRGWLLSGSKPSGNVQ